MTHACTALLCATIASPAHSALAVFTDRAAWQTAAGGIGDQFENFNSNFDDVLYGPAPVTAGFLTLSVVDGQADSSWRIDALPVAFSTIPDVNGTTFVITIGAGFSGFGDTFMSFAPLRALGFDYSGASYSTVDGVLSTSLGDSVGIATSTNTEKSFIGILYTAGETFTSIKWNEGVAPVTLRAFGAGIDNVEAFSAVPLPASCWMLGSALVGLAAARRRREN